MRLNSDDVITQPKDLLGPEDWKSVGWEAKPVTPAAAAQSHSHAYSGSALRPRSVHFWFDMDKCTVHVKFGDTDTIKKVDVPVVPGSSMVLSMHGKALAKMPEFATLGSITPISMAYGWNFIEINDDGDDVDNDA